MKQLVLGDRVVYLSTFYSHDVDILLGEKGTVTKISTLFFSVLWDGGHFYEAHMYPEDFRVGYIEFLHSNPTWFDIWEPRRIIK